VQLYLKTLSLSVNICVVSFAQDHIGTSSDCDFSLFLYVIMGSSYYYTLVNRYPNGWKLLLITL
jgi:hypothetical protein